MATEGQISQPLAARTMLAITGGALIAATLIMFGAVLPAEFHWDPLGLGHMSGLDRLWAPSEVAFDTSKSEVAVAREYRSGLRSDVIEIPLRAGGDSTRGDELEYKVKMKKEATLVYEWSVAGCWVKKQSIYRKVGEQYSGWRRRLYRALVRVDLRKDRKSDPRPVA